MAVNIWHNDPMKTTGKRSFDTILERRFYSKGEIIVREGSVGSTAYVIQHGRVCIFTERNGTRVELAQLETGDIFGESALLTDSPRNASVEVVENCNVIIIRQDDFDKKLAITDSTIRAVVEMLINRLNGTNRALANASASRDQDIALHLNSHLSEMLSALPEADKDQFKSEAFPAMDNLLQMLKDYRSKL